MYALLEMKVGLMQTEFETGFARLVRAICRFYGLQCGQIIQTWTRTCIRNDSELVEMCKNSVGIISTETIIKNHPFVESVPEEMERIEQEKIKEREQFDIYNNSFRKND